MFKWLGGFTSDDDILVSQRLDDLEQITFQIKVVKLLAIGVVARTTKKINASLTNMSMALHSFSQRRSCTKAMRR